MAVCLSAYKWNRCFFLAFFVLKKASKTLQMERFVALTVLMLLT